MTRKAGRSGKARLTGRDLAVRVKTAKRRRSSSTRWLQRQLNDPYVAATRSAGFRSRAAYKLLELDDRFQVLQPGMAVVDLGAAPGGWSQVAAERVSGRGRIVAVDRVAFDPIAGVEQVIADVTEPACLAQIRAALGGAADLVLSDMAPTATGHRSTDHIRIIGLVEAAAELAALLLAPGGGLIAKVWQGGTEAALLATLKTAFARVRHAKPPASRADSAEVFLIATGFRGR